MIYSNTDTENFNTLWHEYIGPKLGKKPLNQFLSATQKQEKWFAEIIRPRLFVPDQFGGVYYPVDVTTFSVGRNHHVAETIASEADPLTKFGGDPWSALTYFANPLRVWHRSPVGEDKSINEALAADAPKDRVVLGDYHILTYEFDLKNVEFLKEQLSWLRSPGNKLDSRIGRLFKRCSGYADFCGITVNYSGSKSLHIHVVFSTALARQKLGLDGYGATDLRDGFAAHWERLHETLLPILDVQGLRADSALRFAEAFRRVPNGCRVVDGKHLLGIPEGTLVPQITLWEESRSRAAGDDLPLFWTPEAFGGNTRARKRTKNTKPQRAGKPVGDMNQEEMDYCATRLREWYPDWPRFDHLDFDGRKWSAKFRNSEADRTPSSIMRENYATIHLVGRDAAELKSRRLPYDLGVMLRLWRGQLASEQGRVGDVVMLDDLITVPTTQPLTEIERRFRDDVIDKTSAAAAMNAFFRVTVPVNPSLMVVAPEGVGKTSVVMAQHHEIAADLERRGESSLGMYAFADYKTAAEKCDDFNTLQQANGFVGVVIPSFARMYEEECERIGVKMISIIEAARTGFASRLSAIRELQPQVMDRFRQQHAQVWSQIGGQCPVFFGVHQVAHDWWKNSPTRTMWARSYWMEGLGDDRDAILRKETDLGLLVHDEVKWDSLVDAQPEAVVRWVEDMTDQDRKVWGANRANLHDRLRSFEHFSAQHDRPLVGDTPLTFEDAQRIADVVGGLGSWDHVVTADSGEYRFRKATVNDNGEAADFQDGYEQRHGRDWRVVSKNWWSGVADRVILLTTEAVPTAVARTADPDMAIFELEAPKARRDLVDVYADRSVRGDNLASLCTDFRADRPAESWFIVSNRVQTLPDTMTHAGARGSNALKGLDILQTMTWMTAFEYEQLQALNAWTGRNDLVGLRHIDEFNQTAGRNLGFRHQGDARHTLLVNLRLLDVLLDHHTGVLGRARYGLRLHMDSDQRYEATGRAKSRAA
ncbi:hypothetical protein [Bosea sp. ANAM02]|uniref:hypothetical protein n=1 Tax=Bosea sp. ANAM02 TaxID=2020412 RepID=UPI00140F202C|nr:hypothetical protein [Bosea sp. ANAM02]BCB19202.1 hypothetical protein OCUBac02_20960 [Bosea sp. ANAM02]